MCGIAGFTGVGGRAQLEAMIAALAHRGPDDKGVYVDEAKRVFLGHRRLSIIDLESGAQPMWDASGRIGVVYNGEIYNHKELRHDLESRGHRFRTSHSDTEVLIHGYLEWGRDLPLHLNGMFAFAIYDVKEKCIFLARDRFGEKPLYYTQSKNFFAFASELNALAQHPNVSTSVNVTALQKLFAYGYIPSPHTFYEGSSKLPGGHSLLYDLSSGKSEVKCYWRFELQADESLNEASEQALADELQALIIQSAKRRLISDVPLGVFLSGGIDSSVVLGALAHHVPPEHIQTFTLGFTEKSFDESIFASQVADHFGTKHHTKQLSLDTARSLIPEVLSHLDEPLGDASFLPSSLLAEFTRENVTVALSGDGGDELFAGYDPFLALKAAHLYDRVIPNILHKGIRSLAGFLPVSHKNMSFDFKIKRTLMGLSYPEQIRLPVWMAPLEPNDLNDLLLEPVDPLDLYSEALNLWEECSHLDLIDKTMTFFTRFYLQDDILMKMDRATMMHSLESRAVFLDNDLVSFCQRLPGKFKYRNGERKVLLKRVAERMLPENIVKRKKKGFGIPLTKWLKTFPPEPPRTSLPGINPDYVQNAFVRHRAGKKNESLFLWSWLSAQYVIDRG